MDCIPSRKYVCDICIKEYSSRQNLWKHNNKYHMIENTQNVTECNTPVTNCNINVTECNTPVTINEQLNNNITEVHKLICNICNKQFNNRQTKWRHEKKCKKPAQLDKVEKMELESLELKEDKPHHKVTETNNTVNGTNNNIIYINKDATKEIFNKDITRLISYIEKSKIKKNEKTLKILNKLKSMDMNKEMFKQLNILSYNNIDVVEDTIYL